MRKHLRLLAVCCLVVILLAGCKGRMIIDSDDMSASAEDLLKTAPLVFLGVVSEESEGHYRNETEVHKNADGSIMYNYWVTPYTVKVLEVYKGDLDESTQELTVSTLNLYSNEDMTEQRIETETYYMQVGDKMIFCVSYEQADESYVPLFDDLGYFEQVKGDVYRNAQGEALDVSRIKETLQSAENNGVDLLAGTNYTAVIKPEHLAK